jgi:small subunit ribosomal protein S15
MLGQWRQNMLTKETTAAVVKQFGKKDTNTGSTEVQIALITEKIKALAPHFEKNKKDHSGMRGLMKIIGQRRSLLKHLAKTDTERYTKILAELGLRK